MPKKKTVVRRKGVGISHTYRGPSRHKRPGAFTRLLQRLPRWAWWMGGAGIAGVYIWFFYYFFVSPYGFRWRALYGDISYPEGYEIHGIDISHYQGTIDWNTLKNEALIKECPIRFIMIKATEGATQIDENFEDNFYQAREHGFMRGAYHFFSPGVSPRLQAEYFLHWAKLEDGDLPPVLDIEKDGGMSVAEVRKAALEWLRIVEARCGQKPIIYTSYKFKLKYLDTDEFAEFPYWIAHYYVDKVEYKGEWKFWQYTDCGRLPGITGNVDCNVYNGSMYDLKRHTIRTE